MKLISKFFVLAIMLSMVAIAGRYTSPESAALNCKEVREAIAQGYVVNQVSTEQVLYKIEPTGVYLYGQVTIIAESGNLSTTYKRIVCEVYANSNGKQVTYQVTNVEVTEGSHL